METLDYTAENVKPEIDLTGIEARNGFPESRFESCPQSGVLNNPLSRRPTIAPDAPESSRNIDLDIVDCPKPDISDLIEWSSKDARRHTASMICKNLDARNEKDDFRVYPSRNFKAFPAGFNTVGLSRQESDPELAGNWKNKYWNVNEGVFSLLEVGNPKPETALFAGQVAGPLRVHDKFDTCHQGYRIKVYNTDIGGFESIYVGCEKRTCAPCQSNLAYRLFLKHDPLYQKLLILSKENTVQRSSNPFYKKLLNRLKRKDDETDKNYFKRLKKKAGEIDKKHLFFITLTLRNSGDPVRDFTEIQRCWTRFYRNFFKSRSLGSIGSYEFGSKSLTAHYHMIAFCDDIDIVELRNEWKSATDDSSFEVDIVPVEYYEKRKKKISKKLNNGLRESLKYASKLSKLSDRQKALIEKALKGKRRIVAKGLFSGALEIETLTDVIKDVLTNNRNLIFLGIESISLYKWRTGLTDKDIFISDAGPPE